MTFATKLRYLLGAALLAVGAINVGACAAPVSTLSSHTVQTGPDTQSDVLWMLVGGNLVRCSGEGTPKCERVASP